MAAKRRKLEKRAALVANATPSQVVSCLRLSTFDLINVAHEIQGRRFCALAERSKLEHQQVDRTWPLLGETGRRLVQDLILRLSRGM